MQGKEGSAGLFCSAGIEKIEEGVVERDVVKPSELDEDEEEGGGDGDGIVFTGVGAIEREFRIC
jgi:hypothetical protein